ncbi:MAG: trypsin-like serine protease [Fuerstiella sp.]|nr:trypsin-like serine protease [Fuerstiella sp.]MCP4858401.1 trypsin-like serine protease [Fuerstiella sp.]
MKHIAICFVSAAAGTVFGAWLINAGSSLPSAAGQPPSQQTDLDNDVAAQLPAKKPRAYLADGLTPDEAASAYVYELNNRSVANIATRIGGERTLFRLENPTEDAGSGFVLDMNGHILTNYHVIEDAQRILVTLYNGESYDAEPVGVDPINDIAIIRLDVPKELLFPVTLGDSSLLKVGMKVLAIGNPFGLERTMTTGIISSLNRTLPVTRARSIKSVIQIDAAINPGNSGGPLLDSHGRLIGMNTAIASHTGQSAGIGFAIPSNLLARVIPELIEHGRVIRPDIGITEVWQTEEGLRILRMDPEGPAMKAGLRGPATQRLKRGFVVFESIDRSAADLIVGVNGKETRKVDEFLSEVESHRPGDTVVLQIIRDGKPIQVEIRLTE